MISHTYVKIVAIQTQTTSIHAKSKNAKNVTIKEPPKMAKTKESKPSNFLVVVANTVDTTNATQH